MEPWQQQPPQPNPQDLRAPNPLPPYQSPDPSSNWQQPIPNPPMSSPPTTGFAAPQAQPPQPQPQPQLQPQQQPYQTAPVMPEQHNAWQQPVAPPPAPTTTSTAPIPTTPDDSQNPRYHTLNLSKGEYVIKEVHRHPIGLLQIYLVTAIALLGLFIGSGLLINSLRSGQNDIVSGLPVAIPSVLIVGVAIGLALFTLLITSVAVKVYTSNKLYITNESVIQFIRASLLSNKMQSISLGNVEDASYEQRGLLPNFLGYGRVRLSTEGEHTYYDFKYAPSPKAVVNEINNARENFAAGAPDRHD